MNEDSLYNRLAKGILTDEEIDNLVDEIMNIPSEKNNNCVSTYGSINVDDLISNVKEFKKIPTFDNLLKENKTLKQQLDYLRSGEYHNQLRFENEILQNVVDTNGVPSEVYDYIDCAHRNTELLGKRQKLIDYLKEQINKINEQIEHFDLWREVGVDINFLILKKQMFKEILSKIEKR